MLQSHVSDRLGPLDALFLYLEKKEVPLHVGSVFILDGPLSVDALKALIDAKLPLIPRYCQRVVFPPLNAGYPTWEYDPEFDMDRHIHHARLKPGTLEALEALSGRLFSEIMDRSRPLWDLTVVDGLRGGRSALIARLHHCLVDGVAGVALMNLIFDHSREPAPARRKRTFHPAPLPSPAMSLLDALVSSYSQGVGRLLSAQSAALNAAEALFAGLLQGSLTPALGAAREFFAPARPFPFHAQCKGPRKVSWAEFPMADMNAIREARQVTVNDVVMVVLAGAVRRYARLHRQSVDNRKLRLMVPVNLRNGDPTQGLGNKVSLMPVNIPLDVKDPSELLNTTHNQTQELKHAHAADLLVLGGTLLSLLPVPLQAQLMGLLSNEVPVLPFDMVCTNVPGPQSPLYVLGRKMLTYYPYVPIGDFMGVCCAVVSYNGSLYFSLTGDCACAPDLDRLRDFLYEAFAEVREAAGLAPVRRASAKSNRVAAGRPRPVQNQPVIVPSEIESVPALPGSGPGS